MLKTLKSKKLDFNDLFLLECFEFPENRDYLNLYKFPSTEDYTLSVRLQYLKKEEYLVPDPRDSSQLILSVQAVNLLQELRLPENVKIGYNSSASVEILDLSKPPEVCFEEWWKAYPTTPTWESDDGMKKFSGSRTLKNLNKAEAKKKYLKLLNQGLKHEELLGSLLYEIKIKKIDSIKKNENQMEFFKGMESYFNKEKYLLHIEDYKKNPDFIKSEQKIRSKKSNVKDI